MSSLSRSPRAEPVIKITMGYNWYRGLGATAPKFLVMMIWNKFWKNGLLRYTHATKYFFSKICYGLKPIEHNTKLRPCRSLSCPSGSVSFLPDLNTKTSDQTSEPEAEQSERVEVKKYFHEHPLALLTYLKVNENARECNFCRFCTIYFTIGASIYGCARCNMFLHESCSKLPKWIDSTLHPQHEIQLRETTMYAGLVNGVKDIFTYRYECEICSYTVDVKDAMRSIPISLFKNIYLNGGGSSSLPLYLKKNTTAPKEEDFRIMLAVKVDKIHHFHHEHPLILSTYYVGVEENDQCALCELTFTEDVIIYRCDECRFAIHASCAGLPKLVKSSFHPEHLLDFRPHTTYPFICYGCNKMISECPRYTCRTCYFDIHFKCVLDSYPKNSLLRKSRCLYLPPKATATPSLSRSLSFPMEGKRKSQIIFSEPPPNVPGMSLTTSSFFHFQLAKNADQILHFSHSHPLVSLINKMEYEYQYSLCKICGETILPNVTIYGCHECKFYIHKSCGNLPQTLRNTLHPVHMLQLIKVGLEMGACQLCDGRMDAYGFGCSDCRFYLHCQCAPVHNFEHHKVQEHTFHYFKASLFTCDACGVKENEERVSCLCRNCPLQVHKRCSYSFPRTVKQNRHPHKLILTYSFEVDFDYTNETCKICFNQMKNVYCFYQCHDCCTYIAHVKCATSVKNLEEESTVEETIEELVTSEEAEGYRVEHFSHPEHCLTFTKEEPKIYAVCNACVSPISAPFYACVTNECNFYLHKYCFELPLKIQHPLHEHRLTLARDSGFFVCYGCGFLCNGFSYKCFICYFHVDVRCSLFSDTLKHDGHDCTLTLIDYRHVRNDEAIKPLCSVCEHSSYKSSCKFSCRRCNFHLDLGCASLPKSVTHECPKYGWNAHPLQLTYGGIEDASGIYFCDMCEESRVISHWFYNCDDCVWSNHPQCVLGQFQFKYGKTYDMIPWHSHKLQLVKKPLSRFVVYPCDICKESLDDSPLFCAECNLYIHSRCKVSYDFNAYFKSRYED